MQHLYISYPPDDYDLAHRLVDDLQSAGYVVFVDAVTETGSMAWAAETRRAIRGAGALIMILSLNGRRRIGIRHEGVIAKRRNLPTFVLIRSPGTLPRYLSNATVVDFTGSYDAALAQLIAALPDAQTLLTAPAPIRQRRHVIRRQSLWGRMRRGVAWSLVLGIVLVLCVALVIALGIIPV